MASATLALRGWQLSARALIADGLDFAVSPTESVAEVGLLVGRTWHAGSTSIYAQAGPIRASTVTRGKFLYQEDSAFETKVYEEIDRQNLGLGLEAGISKDGSIGGIGVAVVADLNASLPMLGVTLTFRLGNLR